MLIFKTQSISTGANGNIKRVSTAMRCTLAFVLMGFGVAHGAEQSVDNDVDLTSENSVSSVSPAVTSHSSHWTLGSAVGEGDSDLIESENNTELSTTGVIVNRFNVEDASVGWKFNVGFDLTRNFAIKAGYMDLNDANGETNSIISDPAIFDQGNKGPTNTAEGFSLGSVYRYNVTDALDFTGSVGVFNWEGNLEPQALGGGSPLIGDQTGGTDIYFGLGGGYQINEDVSLSIEWEHYKLNDEDTDMLSIGVNYHFK